MKHLYHINEYGEIYAANSKAEVIEYYRWLVDEDPEFVEEIPDDQILEFEDDGQQMRVVAGTYASQFNTPIQVVTEYN